MPKGGRRRLIAIRNPLTTFRQHDFVGFEISLFDIWIENDAQARGLTRAAGLADLEAKVIAAMETWNGLQAA